MALFGILVYLHVALTHNPAKCLSHVVDSWPRHGILRVEIICNISVKNHILDTYKKVIFLTSLACLFHFDIFRNLMSIFIFVCLNYLNINCQCFSVSITIAAYFLHATNIDFYALGFLCFQLVLYLIMIEFCKLHFNMFFIPFCRIFCYIE